MGRQSTLQRNQWDTIIKTGPGGRPPRRRHGWLYRLGVTAMILGLVISLMAAGLLVYANLRIKNKGNDDLRVAERGNNEPMNVLILGSDTRDVLTAEQRKEFGTIGGKRADTIILLHIDEDREKAVLIHFPRDLRVRYPNGKLDKINGVYADGPNAVIQTVEDLTKLPIHHYVEVNFNGFNKIVDALGGVDVYFERPIRDKDSGLNVPKGCVTVEGAQALAFVRVRKIDSDFGRIERQQLFLKLMMDKVTTKGTLLNPVKVVRLINLFSDNVETDADLDLGEMKALAGRLRGINSGKVDMRLVPSAGARIRGVDFVIANDEQASALFTAMRERRPLPDYGRTAVSALDPADIRVTVYNGTAQPDLAKKEADVLQTRGFVIPAIGNALNRGAPFAKTTVYYAQGNEEKAKVVAAYYGAELKTPIPGSLGATSELALVLGTDFAEGRATPPPPSPVPSPRKGAKPPPPPAKPLVHEC